VEHDIQDILPNVDASVIVTAHKEFQEINPKIFTKMKTPILIDSRGVIDISSANDAGLVFRGLGRIV
jgi:UDP-N-acetyl-D-mannosaminuronate dehydrogenase